MIRYKSLKAIDWVSTVLKFKRMGDKTQIKICWDMPGRTAVIFMVALFIGLIGGITSGLEIVGLVAALIVAVIYEIYTRPFMNEVTSRIQMIDSQYSMRPQIPQYML